MGLQHSNKPVIATLGTHSALQILKGARDEGLPNLCICRRGKEQPYRSFGVADEILLLDDWSDWDDALEEELLRRNAVVVPHGSFVAYLGSERIHHMRAAYFGTKGILEWESDRTKERQWLEKAGLLLPEVLKKPEDIDRPVIVKFHGAGGGFGYFIARSPDQFYEVKNRKYPDEDDYVIQEYIVGVPLYIHYFYSPMTGELEIMSMDKRYESNADSIGRIRAADQLASNIYTSYTIVGNIPVVVRESMLPELFAMGERVVDVSKKICGGKGLFGPFCLETIVTRKLHVYVFEISARIVAGTNPFVEGSPYTALKYDVPMSTGRRIAREIRIASEQGRLEDVLDEYPAMYGSALRV
ncbi:5-formaminoimidazole-4-carboxamide-1-(beta)-D-ribofuranosyl 5'-monophosphate synthetase [Candidatus Peregrinibacteria bacterium CG10_big_fil_rev_8_21_14_0_10_49_16]|nr:MAG: 5-formaminoimidazole-4-carboxamide-1-(beta)-D-ribofuranosyl 5'-monophosphate synthetase [Candidatus Peregrinibacteria bacterium CG22_combo_CG10-13_8_21_14_all_49_11]PIR51999.1 MAG: 5-formaminoimidazole-4-carboxamide-1-(beta)-D-ribofuranosyl 5'-monophosphate synthetase [Candidatus Peregrinibacteria bacterium CG10_big_fil_rev_8_21_14_0_10_49_16]